MNRTIESTTDTKEEVQKTIGSFNPKAKVETPASPAVKVEDKTAASGTVEANETKESPKEKAAKEVSEESDSVDSSVEEGSNNEGKDAKQGKNGFKKRIDKLVKQRADAEAERDAIRAERDALRAAVTKPVEKIEAPAKLDNGKPTADKFKTNEEYIEALTDWKIDQKQKEQEGKSSRDRVRSEREKTINDHNSRVKEFVKTTPDFDDVLHEVDHVDFPPAFADIVLTHERGPELMYHLAKDPDNYERITKLSPMAMAREIGKFEAKLESPSEETTTVETKKTTNAPAPVRSLSGSAVVPKKTLDGAKSYSDYKAARMAGAKK